MAQSYKKRRQKANAENQKIRKIIEKKTRRRLPKKIEVDDIKSIKKGGSPTSWKNKRLVPRRVNRKKGAK